MINNLSPSDPIIKVTKLLYCINLVFSYPLTIYPTNTILEGFILSGISKENTTIRLVLENFSRFCICVLGCFCSIIFQAKLDQFLGISGAVLGIPIILIVPSICHFKLCAKTKAEKIGDIAVICLSLGAMGICSYNGFSAYFAE